MFGIVFKSESGSNLFFTKQTLIIQKNNPIEMHNKKL